MTLVKIMLITFILSGLAFPVAGCASESGSESLSQNQIATVQRGNLVIDITAVGNLALSRTEELAFDLFYQEGTVEEVLVEEGDTVEKGQVLAKLDTEEWEDELSTLEDQVTAKERDLLQAEINLQTAEQNLKNAQDNEAAKKLALLNAQISLDQAEYNLSVAEETHTWPDLEIAEAEVEKAEAFLQYALDGGWENVITRAQAELDAAERVYNALVQGYDTEEVAIKKLQVESAELSLAQAEEDLNEVAKDVALKELQLTLSQGRLEDAKKALTDAQEKLEEANSKSPLIEAPFDGFITKVNVEGGDEVLSGTVAVQLADPNRFEADIMVSEMDILQVKLGGDAWVQVDAMSGMSLSAKVTHISPTATIQSGVVNYQVKVEIESHEAVMRERQQAQGGQQRQIPTEISRDFQLREGLTVTVHILVAEKNNVLLVPNQAITRLGMETHVQVSKDGVTEERVIQVGISDWQFTEVTDGLSEGEQIIVPTTTETTSPTPRSPIPFMRPPHD
ncbi:MAG: HlyD family efflux transporter periplasmic adaptor subunit [Dehalococcoidia bacterium]|nr:MAG: HlyD family efflux transporter periplasmic adaptor subunit [Dehalococcoidia bacterium]